MWFVRERLYLGNYRSGEAALNGARRSVGVDGEQAPFTGVVSLCPVPLFPGEPPLAAVDAHTEWLLHPILDGGNGEAEFEQAIERALPFMRERMEVGNVLVHCAAGMSRSVSVIAAFMCAEGAHPDTAFSTIADAKARALAEEGIEQEFLIAPAWEFRSCLRRLFAAGD